MYLVPFLWVGYNIPPSEEVSAWPSFKFSGHTLGTILVLWTTLVILSAVSLSGTGRTQSQLWRHFKVDSPRGRGVARSVGEKVIVKGMWSEVTGVFVSVSQ